MTLSEPLVQLAVGPDHEGVAYAVGVAQEPPRVADEEEAR